MNVHVFYFAMMKEAAGLSSEALQGDFATARDLWDHLRRRHAFPLDAEHIRVAVNGAYVSFNAALADGDEVAFIPPVAGG